MALERARSELDRGLRRAVASERAVGFVAGISRRDVVEVKTYGKSGGGIPLGPDTLLEIGSITKTFTGLLLGDMVVQGEVSLEDPVARYLPVPIPSLERDITLLDLATHTSRLPTNGGILLRQAMANRREPFARYTTTDLLRQVPRRRRRRGAGRRFRYSNVGFGLLGLVLERAADAPYEDLLAERICRPLGLASTTAMLSPELAGRLAQGHRRGGDPVPDLRIGALVGAGALRSTVRDMLGYARAHLRPQEAPLSEAIRLALGPHRRFRGGRFSAGLGWLHLRRGSRSVVWHNGGTPGFGACVAMDPEADAAVVILSNSRYLVRLTGLVVRALDRLAHGS